MASVKHGFWKKSGRIGPKTELRRVWKAQKQGVSKVGILEIKESRAFWFRNGVAKKEKKVRYLALRC